MGMVREFFEYFSAVMMGRRDMLTAFVEPLTMGERYYRWGLENGDIRDFRAGMDYLHLCNDQDAPMASLLLRKYHCIADITVSAIDSLLTRHSKVIEDSFKTESAYREERETILKAVAESRDRVRRYQEEGSLIKAKNEERRTGELVDNAARYEEMIESGAGRSKIYDSYDEISADAQRFFRELDQAAVTVVMPNRLGRSTAESLSGQLRSKLEHLKDRLEKANPVVTLQGKSGREPEDGSGRVR